MLKSTVSNETQAMIDQINSLAPKLRDPWCVPGCPGTTYSEQGASKCACWWRMMRRQKWEAVGGPPRLFEAAKSPFEAAAAFGAPGERATKLLDLYSTAITCGVAVTLRRGAAVEPIVSLALCGGDRTKKSTWAASLMQSCLINVPLAAQNKRYPYAARWYDFAALRAILSDYTQAEEQREIIQEMRETYLVVVANVQGGPAAPAFSAAWDTMIAARHAVGTPTVILAENDLHSIKSLAWQDFLADGSMLVAPIDTPRSKAAHSSPKPFARQQTAAPSAKLTDSESVEAAIIDLIARKKSPIWSVIRDNIPADEKLIGQVLRDLQQSGDVTEEKRTGRDGRTLTVYTFPFPADNEAPPSASTNRLRSLAELAAVTGKGKSTVGRWRAAGLSDEEILTKKSE
jgi:hypothetical protein